MRIKTIVAAGMLLFSATVFSIEPCEDIYVGDADVKYIEKWEDVARERPECAIAKAMIAMAWVNDAQPPLLLYMPGAERHCPDADPKIRALRLDIIRRAVRYADQALLIDSDYIMAWRVKLRAVEPTIDFQSDMPRCKHWYMGDASIFIRTVKEGARAISNPRDKFDYINDALYATIAQGSFRENGEFSEKKGAIIHRFLSAEQERDLRDFAVRELKLLLPVLDDKNRVEAQRIVSYLMKNK